MNEITEMFAMLIAGLFSYLLLALPWIFIIFAIRKVIEKKKEENRKKNEEYMQTTYYKSTKIPLSQLEYDTGRYGEYLIYKELQWLERYGVRFLFNVYIPKKNGKTSEIDVIMICDRGIFVYESKNYSGWIFGSEHQKNWYQTIHAGRGNINKETFYNPIMQNRSHIKHLSALFSNKMPFQSIIVFSNRCELMNIEIHSSDIKVIHRYEINDTTRYIYESLPIVFTPQDIVNIYNRLYPLTQVSSQIVEKHIENIVNTKEMFERAEELNICPYCNSPLVLRIAKNNPANRFYGCSRFPKCRYTRNI